MIIGTVVGISTTVQSRFAAPDGTPFDMRSLPPNVKYSPLTT